jgi:hypothetical protein
MQSTVQLNPKIDSKTQRRLQCSISLDKLIPNINIIFTIKMIFTGTYLYIGL